MYSHFSAGHLEKLLAFLEFVSVFLANGEVIFADGDEKPMEARPGTT